MFEQDKQSGALALNRRTMLVAPGALTLAAVSQACAQPAAQSLSNSTTLVAYFTRSGNTRVIARSIHRALGADLFEIQPAQAYPEDYYDTVARAAEETTRGFEPPLLDRIVSTLSYQTVYLGFPIWGQTAPPIIRSFLRSHDFKGKTFRPFVTHGGFGLGNSLSILASHASEARIEQEFSLEADQERRTLETASRWAGVELR